MRLLYASAAVFFVSSAAAAQPGPSSAAAPSNEPRSDLAAQRFEIGWRLGITPGRQFFTGIAASVALNRWFALGTEIEKQIEPNDGEDLDDLDHGIQTFALAELRIPLGHEALRLFGHVAAGPAFRTVVTGETRVEFAVRETLGFEVRLWHVYARPFGYFETMTYASSSLGLGFETGATF